MDVPARRLPGVPVAPPLPTHPRAPRGPNCGLSCTSDRKDNPPTPARPPPQPTASDLHERQHAHEAADGQAAYRRCRVAQSRQQVWHDALRYAPHAWVQAGGGGWEKG